MIEVMEERGNMEKKKDGKKAIRAVGRNVGVLVVWAGKGGGNEVTLEHRAE